VSIDVLCEQWECEKAPFHAPMHESAALELAFHTTNTQPLKIIIPAHQYTKA
jgi:hypothetical protein